MTPKELRLDNWVLYAGRHFKIYGISKEYPFLDTIEFGVGVVEWKDLQPIPLTEEILFKCGFVDKGTHLQFNIANNWCFEWFDGLLGFSICKGGKGLCLGKIKHLHNLQNLYWCLCGKELNVNM